jgi:adenylosuccinate synthase
LGVPPRVIDNIIGVVKAYTTRVGHGPFPTELQNEMQTLEDYVEEYVGEPVRVERAGHSKGAYVAEPGMSLRVGEMLQELGHEYGTTTGRRRRCGWLDVPLVKYSAMINGFTSISITKLDVLTGLKQIRVAVAYRNADMSEVRLPSGYFPAHLDDLKKVVCEYETLDGWSENLGNCRSFCDLPEAAQRYVLRIQELIGVKVSSVGVGPDRADIMMLD